MARENLKFWLGATIILAGIALGGCQQGQEEDGPDLEAIFGNGYASSSPIICKIGDLAITQAQLEMRYEELPRSLKGRFSGDGWERRFLRYMVDEYLLVKGAIDRELYLIPEISQHLISQRRSALKTAMQDFELHKNVKPTEDQIREHYKRNIRNYMRQGTLRARHIECLTKETAYEAYNRLQQGGREGQWDVVCAEFTKNLESGKQGGELGWFNRRAFIPAIPYAREFAEYIWDWDIGIHEPVLIGGRWHVIDVVAREHERPLTLNEARDRIVEELTPLLQREAVEAYLDQAAKETPIEYFANYRPGQGRSPEELFELAWYANSPEQQIDYYLLLVDDFPKSDLADNALFMIANIHLDKWNELSLAARYLDEMINKYPDSELVEDARYMLEHMYDRDFSKPTDIQQLRPKKGEKG